MNNSCLIVGCLKENLNFNVVHVLNLFSLWVEKSLLFASFLKQLACFKFNVWILILVIEWCGKVQMNTKWWKAMTSSLGHKLLVILWFHQAHDFTIHWIFNFLYCRNYFDFVSCLFPNPFMSYLWMLKFITTVVFLLFMETRKQLRMHILFYGFRIR